MKYARNMLDNTIERWKSIPEAPSYSISSFGRVARVSGGQGARPMIRRQDLEHTGYLRVRLSEGGVRLRLSVHRLVAFAFLGNPPTDRHQVAHYDGDKTNNHVSNLRWATCKENIGDKKRHGTQPRGESQGRSKLTEKDVIAIRESSENYRVLAKRYGVHKETINRIRSRKNWSHI